MKPRHLLHLLLVSVMAAVAPSRAGATVTSSTRTVTHSPSTPTTVFSVTYNFHSCDDLTVTLTEISSGTATTQTNGVHFSCKAPVWPVYGSITMFSSVTSTHTLTIARNTEPTQEISFKGQGSYSAALHESAFDKCVMLVQDTIAAAGTDGAAAVATHEGKADPHSQYVIEDGRGTGQHVKGGDSSSGSGANLQLSSTDHTTKGKVLIGSGGTELVLDDVNNLVGIGTASPSEELDLVGDLTLSGDIKSVGSIYLTGAIYGDGLTAIVGGDDTTEDLILQGNSSTIDSGDVYVWNASGTAAFTFDADDVLFFVGTSDVLSLTHSGSNQATIQINDSLGADSQLRLRAAQSAATGASVEVFGENHATNPDDIRLTGDRVLIQDEAFATSMIIEPEAVDFQGTVEMRHRVEVLSGSVTVDEATDCETTFVVDDNGENVELPQIASDVIGCRITVVIDGTSIGTQLTVHSADGVMGHCVYDNGGVAVNDFDGTVNKDILMSSGNQQDGDWIIIEATEATRWNVVSCHGQWTRQT